MERPARPLALGGHVPALDGLRGLAICLVLLHHFTLFGGMQPRILVDRLFYEAAMAGWCGVDLFFVLSGFLITGILVDTKGGRHFFTNFYMRRFLRIFPLYYGFLLFVFIVLPWLLPSIEALQSLKRNQVWYWTYLSNFLYVGGWDSDSYVLGHFWSLAVEEQFYLVWPLLVFRCPQRVLRIICMVCILCGPLIRLCLWLAGHPTAGYVLTPARSDALAMGALLALTAREPGGLARLSRFALPGAVTATVALSILFIARAGLDFEDVVVQLLGYSLLTWLFGALLVMAITAPKGTAPDTLFAHPVLRFFGRYSYAMYVFHQPVILLLKAQVLSVGSVPQVLGSQLPGQAVFFAAATPPCLGLAVLSWHLYEAHFLRLKALFAYGLSTSVPGGTSVDTGREDAGGSARGSTIGGGATRAEA